ncbi:TRAP transporter small permease [Candidatus Halocynthiibacter alkanivorans]|uniref:TRAP transporter small permease n=1 Tax=Candidatus Halocynthiibacter alkanivorans TaxID=2267619 RepID=UPI000DF2BBC4|nr:TRAP transporter small permease [Candidatus Halocynthiibacter alkanivorans]
MDNFKKWFIHGSEFIAAGMLAAMFLTFLLQIFSRYVLLTPFGWTLELCLTLWIWLVFFGNAFVVRERDHVTFDIFYLMAPSRVRRFLALISAAAIAGGMIWAFLPTWDYIDWMKIRKSATLKIPLRTVFSIYAIFMIAVAARYIWRFIDILRNGPPDSDHDIPGHEPELPAIRHGEDAI